MFTGSPMTSLPSWTLSRFHPKTSPGGGLPGTGRTGTPIHRLSAHERAEVIDHLALCDECRAVFDTIADAQDAKVIEREGEVQIARDAATLREKALARLAVLEGEP